MRVQYTNVTYSTLEISLNIILWYTNINVLIILIIDESCRFIALSS